MVASTNTNQNRSARKTVATIKFELSMRRGCPSDFTDAVRKARGKGVTAEGNSRIVEVPVGRDQRGLPHLTAFFREADDVGAAFKVKGIIKNGQAKPACEERQIGRDELGLFLKIKAPHRCELAAALLLLGGLTATMVNTWNNEYERSKTRTRPELSPILTPVFPAKTPASAGPQPVTASFAADMREEHVMAGMTAVFGQQAMAQNANLN